MDYANRRRLISQLNRLLEGSGYQYEHVKKPPAFTAIHSSVLSETNQVTSEPGHQDPTNEVDNTVQDSSTYEKNTDFDGNPIENQRHSSIVAKHNSEYRAGGNTASNSEDIDAINTVEANRRDSMSIRSDQSTNEAHEYLSKNKQNHPVQHKLVLPMHYRQDYSQSGKNPVFPQSPGTDNKQVQSMDDGVTPSDVPSHSSDNEAMKRDREISKRRMNDLLAQCAQILCSNVKTDESWSSCVERNC